MATDVRLRIENASMPEPNSGCWLWLGNLNHNGYGTLAIKIGEAWRTVRAHRASYEAFIAPIPSDLDACHSCDNRACVNPAHVFPGTRQQNVDDCLEKGRNAAMYGISNGRAKINEETARIIHNRLQAGEGPSAIARDLGISRDICKNISKGKGWRHLADTPPQSGWRDIASAPRDGSEIEIAISGKRHAFWDDELKTWVLSRPVHIESIRDPQCYRPIAPPQSEGGEG